MQGIEIRSQTGAFLHISIISMKRLDLKIWIYLMFRCCYTHTHGFTHHQQPPPSNGSSQRCVFWTSSLDACERSWNRKNSCHPKENKGFHVLSLGVCDKRSNCEIRLSLHRDMMSWAHRTRSVLLPLVMSVKQIIEMTHLKVRQWRHQM